MGPKENGPCLYCTDRYVGCHGKCEKYAEWKKRHDDYNTKVYNNRHKEKFFARYVRDRNRHLKEV